MSEREDISNSETVVGIRESNSRLMVYVLALLFFWATVLAYTIHPILPDNPIQLPFEDVSPLTHLLPQGWSFFTRNPRLPDPYVYVRSPDGWQLAPSFAADRDPLAFFSRSSKLPGVEADRILHDLPQLEWQECRNHPSDCLATAPLGGTVKNTFPMPSLCGDIGLVSQELIPWAWSRATEEIIMPSKVLRVRALCDEQSH
jgi:antimicrobial peptide system SdpA family protein